MAPKATPAIDPKQATEDDVIADMVDGDQPAVRRIFFDFDQTISRCHVFKQLAGWEKCCIQPPFALTDRGQIAKIAELNAQGTRWTYDDARQGVFPAGPSGGELWTRAALGGSGRVESLRSLFADLRSK